MIVIAIQLTDLPATANGDKADPNESRIIRDKAYTHMKTLVDEIREAGGILQFSKT